jgi:hypothetical protein
MYIRLTPVAVFLAAALAIGAAQSQPQPPTAPNLTVHEWGTFTSIAGPDGQAVSWLPQSGATDLPCFVERSLLLIKIELGGTVRMETPVLYFYSPDDITVGVDVTFKGRMTEWYPHADAKINRLSWPAVKVSARGSTAFPVEPGSSHYYNARATDAAPLQVGSQTEKFLFYRGVGQFEPPLSAIAREDGKVAVTNTRGVPLGDVIFFENRRGAMAASVSRIASSQATLERPELDDASGPPLRELEQILVRTGLYEKEAHAMVETWRDSWFEEGARLLYIVPGADVDAILPLTLLPRPGSMARVFVGRIELVTPATLRDVKRALAADDRAVLDAYGRFLEPIAARLHVPVPLRVAFPPPCR